MFNYFKIILSTSCLFGSCVFASDSEVSSVGSSTPTKTNEQKMREIRELNDFKRQKKPVQKRNIRILTEKVKEAEERQREAEKRLREIDAMQASLRAVIAFIDDLSRIEQE